jgi:anti-sigma B factor antagonist
VDIKIKDVEGVGVISISGELDALTSPELIELFSSQETKSYLNIIADLSGLDYSSSAGIRVFLGLARDLRRKKGDLRISGVQPHVDKIFKLSKFDKIVRIFPTVEDAIQSFKSNS